MSNPVRSPIRLRALEQTCQMDSPAEESFDRLTRLAATVLQVPVALVSLVDADRQFFKSQVGLPEPLAMSRETPLSHSFCQHVVNSANPLIIADARNHPLVQQNPAIRDLGVIAYAGMPLVTSGGHVVGSFCAIDTKPREWSSEDLQILKDLAGVASGQLEVQAEHDRAAAANRAKDRFLAILSHELRTPVSPALMLSSSMADDESLPPQVREDSRTIQRNLNQQTRLIDDLLDVTRIENGKLALHVMPVDLNALLHDVIHTCGPEAKQKRVGLSLDPISRIHHMEADPVRLRQVFSNLIKNAVKFTPAGGSVCVRVSQPSPQRVMIKVIDTGIGIDPRLLPSIFDAYEQGGRAITDEFSGLGLGLAIAKGLVAAHGGSIHADSDGTGTGTTLTVDLPTCTAPILPAVIPEAPEPSTPRAGLRILLVDDHRDTLNAMSRLLRLQGHVVTSADCVASALAAADGANIDLLISDIGLPDGTGLDLIRELLKRWPVKGIALTGYGMEADIEQTLIAGYSAHLTKPIDLNKLEEAISQISLKL